MHAIPTSIRPTAARSFRARSRWAIALLALGLLLATPAIASADPGDVGYQGPLGAGGAPSGSKPESKLWFNDGRWWASMWDTGTSDFYIYQLNSTTETWSRTGTRLDDRSSTRADVLWDGSKLYVASHNFSESDGSGTARLYRYSYNSGSKTYSLDSGFPATINSVRSETLVLAKDSTGQLWATWEAGGTIWVNRTTGSDTSWGSPFALPGAASVAGDDISSIIAFGGDKVGILWSDQSTPNADYFAVHRDVDGDMTWSIETAYAGSGYADDHINLKTDASGTVYAAVKTSLTGSNPLLVLLVRTPSGNWSNHTISIGSTDHTRPILQIDEANSLLRVFYTSGGSGGTINEKTSPMGAISFPSGSGTVVIKDASALKMNNPSSTKQNSSAASGLVVLAYNDTTRYYWHGHIVGGGSPANTPPSAAATSASTAVGTSVPVTLSGSDAETCDLTFSIVSGPSHGTLGSITNAACAAGSPNSDSATVTYTPTGGYTGPDSFTYRVNDGTTDSPTASASLTVTSTPPSGGSLTFTPSDDAQVRSTSAGTNYGALTTIRLREDAAGDTYRSYLKFTVAGLTGPVSGVKLRLYVTDASPDSGSVYAVTSGWSQGTITYTNAPPIGGSVLGTAGSTTVGQWVDITLDPSAVSGNGVVAFGLRSASTNSAIFSSREGTNPPQLVVTQQSGPPPNTAPSAGATSATTTTGQAVTVNLSGTDAETCQLTFEIVSPPTNGTLGDIANAACSAGSPNTDSASVTYTPSASYTGSDAFTYTVDDGDSTSPAATASLTVNAAPPSDTTPPTLSTAAVDGTALVLTYDEALDGASVPAASDYAVSVEGSARSVSTVGVSGTKVTLTLASAVTSADAVTVSYSPGTNPVQDSASNDAATLSAQPVTNSTPPPPPPGGSLTFTVSEDAQVKSSSASTNYGADTTIRVREEAGGINYRSYLKFDVSGVGGPVTAVTLRLFVTDASPDSGSVYAVTNGWDQGTITYANAPAIGGSVLGTAGSTTVGQWVDIALSPSAVSGNGIVSFGLASSSTNSAIFSSREGTNPPQLIVTY